MGIVTVEASFRLIKCCGMWAALTYREFGWPADIVICDGEHAIQYVRKNVCSKTYLTSLFGLEIKKFVETQTSLSFPSKRVLGLPDFSVDEATVPGRITLFDDYRNRFFPKVMLDRYPLPKPILGW